MRSPDIEEVIWLSRIARTLVIMMATMINLVCHQQTPATQNYGSCVRYSVCAQIAITHTRATMKPMISTQYTAVVNARKNASTQSKHVINSTGGGDIMPDQTMDFLEALAKLLNHGVEVRQCITALQRARQGSKYTLVTRFDSYAITYTKQGWIIELN